MSRLRPARWALLALLLTACGPKDLYQVSVHEYDAETHLGRQGKPTAVPAPIPGAGLELGTPGFLIPPLPTAAPLASLPLPSVAPPAPPACPTAGPYASIGTEALPSVSTPPPPGTYTYRQSGRYAIPGVTQVPYPPEVKIYVLPGQKGTPTPGGQPNPNDNDYYWYTYEQTLDSKGHPNAGITYTYRLAPGTAIQIYSIVVKTSPATSTYGPVDPPDLVDFPTSTHPSWNDNAPDVINQTVFADDAHVDLKRDVVDACGTLVDSWRVDMGTTTQTPVVEPPVAPPMPSPTPVAVSQEASFDYLNQPSLSYNIDGWYDLATQWGGLLVAEHIVETAQDGSWTNTRDLTIDSPTPGPLPPYKFLPNGQGVTL